MKHFTMAIFIAAGLIGLTNTKANGQAKTGEPMAPIKASSEGIVASDGLYLTRAKFGRMINVRGADFVVYKGFIYVGWYQGGMDNRSAWLSRKKVGQGQWQHIDLGHRHVMFRGDKDKPESERDGDAHNYIAIGICPKDDTIHLLYDMHAYTPRDFPDGYFNYRHSIKGGAVVPDDKWGIDLFLPKQNYLSKAAVQSNAQTYYRISYPGFWTTEQGNLIVKWRKGGTHDAWMHFSEYDGEQWSAPRIWNDTQGEKRIGFYGGFLPINGRLYARWTHRSDALRKQGFPHGGQAAYAAYCEQLNGTGDWYTLTGEKFALPLKDLEPFKVVEVTDPTKKASSGLALVTPNGQTQIEFCANGQTLLAVLEKDAKAFRITPGATAACPCGHNFLLGDVLYSIGLEDGRPVIYSTKFGTSEWHKRYHTDAGPQFSNGTIEREGNSVFYYLMQVKPRHEDKRPLHVLRFDLPAE